MARAPKQNKRKTTNWKETADKIRDLLVSTAKENVSKSHTIAENIVGEVTLSATNLNVHLSVDRRKAPHARAWEWGSGKYSRQKYLSRFQKTNNIVRRLGKVPKTYNPGCGYVIPPKTKRDSKTGKGGWIAFKSDGARYSDFITSKETGKVVLPYVIHPGVEAINDGDGYIRKAYKDKSEDIKKTVFRAAKQEIIEKFRETFGRKK